MIAYLMCMNTRKMVKFILKDSIKKISKVSFSRDGSRIVILGQNRQTKDLVIILQID